MPLLGPKQSETYLMCAVCGRPVLRGDWFITASQATEDVRTGTAYDNSQGKWVPQRPVHLTCISPLPPKILTQTP